MLINSSEELKVIKDILEPEKFFKYGERNENLNELNKRRIDSHQREKVPIDRGILIAGDISKQEESPILEEFNRLLRLYEDNIVKSRSAKNFDEYESFTQNADLAILEIERNWDFPNHFNLRKHLLDYVDKRFKYNFYLQWALKRPAPFKDLDETLEVLSKKFNDTSLILKFVELCLEFGSLRIRKINLEKEKESKESNAPANTFFIGLLLDQVNGKLTTVFAEILGLVDLVDIAKDKTDEIDEKFLYLKANSELYTPIEVQYDVYAFSKLRLKDIFPRKSPVQPKIYGKVALFMKYVRYHCLGCYSPVEGVRTDFSKLAENCEKELEQILPKNAPNLGYMLNVCKVDVQKDLGEK